MNGEALSLTCATISFFVGWCIALIMDWALHKFMEIKNDEPLPEDSEGDQLCTVSRATRVLRMSRVRTPKPSDSKPEFVVKLSLRVRRC